VAALLVASRHTGPTASGKVAGRRGGNKIRREQFPGHDRAHQFGAVTPAVPLLTNGSILHLKFLPPTAAKPIPMVLMNPRAGWAESLRGNGFTSDRFGVCDVVYPTNISELD